MLRALRHWIGLPREAEGTRTGEMLELGWKAILHHWKCLGWVVWGYRIAGNVGVGLEGDIPLLEEFELGWVGIPHCWRC